MAANITVVVRVRPMNDRELEQNNRTVIEIIDENRLVFDPKEDLPPFFHQGVQQPRKNFLKRANKELKFAFDSVCGPNATNQDVFESATKDMLAALMEGYNCSVFVYGATGAGKTHTMIGTKEHPGITYLTVDHLFQTISGLQVDREFDIAVSYIEVYNENVFDLLKPSSTPLQLRDFHGVTVAGLSINKIQTAQELLDMLEFGNRNRTQHPTDANAESSRSHAVFQVYVTIRWKLSSQCRKVKLAMIDLAGSERASATACRNKRSEQLKEGANINRSLLALGNCINQLADGNSFIPYRDSKLTRLLKDSLGGNCKTVMIANVSPSSMCYEDTYNTLKYAARANKIQLSIKKNIVDDDASTSQCIKVNKEQSRLDEHIKEIREINTNFERMIAVLNAKEAVSSNTVIVGDSSANHAFWNKRINEVELVHGALESQLLTLMSQARVLALRHFLRTRAFEHVADLAHRSSCDALEQVYTEEIQENYTEQIVSLNLKIMEVQARWIESGKKLQNLLDECLANCPNLTYIVDRIKWQAKNRKSQASIDLYHELCSIMMTEITVSTECMGDAFSMLKKMYLTLKDYGQVPPELTSEYLGMICKVKSAKNTTTDENTKRDTLLVLISSLDLENPTLPLPNQDEDDKKTIIDVITDSDDLTDVENREPGAQKRKGTPMTLHNNDTIVIDDSLDALDAQSINSAKKIRMETRKEFENSNNFDVLDPAGLNSTLVLAGKMEECKKSTKVESNKMLPVKKALTDRTNHIQRTISSNNDVRGEIAALHDVAARIMKPVQQLRRVGAAAPQPRVGAAAPQPRAGSAATEPHAGTAATEPRAGTAATQPRAGTAATEPHAGTAATEPRAGTAATQPRAGTAAPQPHAGTAATEPHAGTAATEPRAGTAATQPRAGTAAPQPRAPFGSSSARDGTNFRTVGFKAVRARDRPQVHPYPRVARKPEVNKHLGTPRA